MYEYFWLVQVTKYTDIGDIIGDSGDGTAAGNLWRLTRIFG
jgi:hypothetical protein